MTKTSKICCILKITLIILKVAILTEFVKYYLDYDKFFDITDTEHFMVIFSLFCLLGISIAPSSGHMYESDG